MEDGKKKARFPEILSVRLFTGRLIQASKVKNVSMLGAGWRYLTVCSTRWQQTFHSRARSENLQDRHIPPAV